MSEKITVVSVKVGEMAKIAQIENTLSAKQKFVGGYIEVVYPFEEPVAVICNEEGKLQGLPLNRALRTEDGEIYDILAGNFLVCYAPPESDDFENLPKDLAEQFKKFFEFPEAFYKKDGKIKAKAYIPKEVFER